MSLSQGLSTLESYDQFMLWNYIYSKKTKKYEKVPVNPQRYPVDAHDPKHQMPYEQANRLAKTQELGLAFVLTDKDPFFCIDIDKCVDERYQFNALAQEIISLLPDVAVEISTSGTGLHVWGCFNSPLSEHKIVANGLEFYTRKRSIALTGNMVQGHIYQNYSRYLPIIIERYLKRTTPTIAANAEWTTTHRHGWSGPASDQDLIEVALRSRNAKAIFGDSASFRDLWTANVDVLAGLWPSVKDSDFDHNKADLSLCAHLAFYTGCNCERMDLLFRQSALTRSKWEDREDYRRNTILLAVTNTHQVYDKDYKKDKLKPKPVKAEINTKSIGGLRKGETFLDSEEQVVFFKGCVYIEGQHRVYCPDGLILKPDAFNVRYGGRTFKLDEYGKNITRKAFEAFTQNQVLQFPIANGLAFQPERPPGQIFHQENLKILNTYVPLNRNFKKGDVSKFFDFLSRLLPNEVDRTILVSYLAALLQYQGRKFRWAIIMQGVQGNGKSMIGTIIEYANGYRYTYRPDDKGLANNFNMWMSGKTLAVVDDVYIKNNYGVLNRLKWMIGNERGPIEPKGVDQATADIRINFFMTMNDKSGFPADENERRYAFMYTPQQGFADLERDGLTERYFKEFADWLKPDGFEAIAYYLTNFSIPNVYNPGTYALRAPMTTSMKEAVEHSRCNFQEAVLAAIEEEQPGFRCGWISSSALRQLSKDIRSRTSIKLYPKKLEQLGYIKCPLLVDGKASKAIVTAGIDVGRRPILYCHNSRVAEIKNASSSLTPTEQYEQAQSNILE